jgi:large subunit ribosomal protein L21
LGAASIIVIVGGVVVYAVFKVGGRQYRAESGDQFLVEKLSVDAGNTVTLDEVLLIADGEDLQIGTPHVESAKVKATVLAHEKGPKIRIFKYRPSKRYRLRKGHRQTYTRLRIDEILVQ